MMVLAKFNGQSSLERYTVLSVLMIAKADLNLQSHVSTFDDV